MMWKTTSELRSDISGNRWDLCSPDAFVSRDAPPNILLRTLVVLVAMRRIGVSRLRTTFRGTLLCLLPERSSTTSRMPWTSRETLRGIGSMEIEHWFLEAAHVE